MSRGVNFIATLFWQAPMAFFEKASYVLLLIIQNAKEMLQIDVYFVRTTCASFLEAHLGYLFQKPDFTLGSSRFVTLKQNRKLESRCRID